MRDYSPELEQLRNSIAGAHLTKKQLADIALDIITPPCEPAMWVFAAFATITILPIILWKVSETAQEKYYKEKLQEETQQLKELQVKVPATREDFDKIRTIVSDHAYQEKVWQRHSSIESISERLKNCYDSRVAQIVQKAIAKQQRSVDKGSASIPTTEKDDMVIIDRPVGGTEPRSKRDIAETMATRIVGPDARFKFKEEVKANPTENPIFHHPGLPNHGL